MVNRHYQLFEHAPRPRRGSRVVAEDGSRNLGGNRERNEAYLRHTR